MLLGLPPVMPQVRTVFWNFNDLKLVGRPAKSSTHIHSTCGTNTRALPVQKERVFSIGRGDEGGRRSQHTSKCEHVCVVCVNECYHVLACRVYLFVFLALNPQLFPNVNLTTCCYCLLLFLCSFPPFVIIYHYKHNWITEMQENFY